MEEKGKPLLILGIAVIVVLFLSFFGWESISGGKLKSYDLFNDIRTTPRIEQKGGGNEYLDPDLAMLNDELYEFIPEEPINQTASIDENKEAIVPTESTPDIDEAESDGASAPEPAETTSEGPASVEGESETAGETGDPVVNSSKTVAQTAGKSFEDYSAGNKNIARLKNALSQTSNRTVRVAVLGDSYIEGDIFTEAIRSSLQSKYGGRGVGYTPLYSPIAGFRQSVTHNCSGFEQLDFRKKNGRPYSLIQGFASKAGGGAATTFTGSKVPNAEGWSRSRILLTAPNGGQIKVRLGKDNSAEWTTYNFNPSDSIQVVDLKGETSRLSIGSISPGIIFQGAYLDDNKGIAIDNMSIRGYSGIRHNEVDASLTAQARPQIDYDLIILEYGINGLSSSQTNYKAYGNRMIEVINHIKKLYPKAVILVMGIGDRGDKIGGETHSMATVPNMIAEQRRIAKETGSLFWDTRGAMGGNDAVVAWAKTKDVNSDYIHLTLKGGKRLANLFTQALDNTLK